LTGSLNIDIGRSSIETIRFGTVAAASSGAWLRGARGGGGAGMPRSIRHLVVTAGWVVASRGRVFTDAEDGDEVLLAGASGEGFSELAVHPGSGGW
jgi:hypothetical protein